MVCSSISKAVLFRRVVKQFCQQNGYRLTESNFYVLFSVIEIRRKEKHSATVADICAFLKRTRRTYATNVVANYLNTLIGYGLIEKQGQYPAKYSPTIAALNDIFSIEQKLRKSRTDR
jgi:hypothetical protein